MEQFTLIDGFGTWTKNRVWREVNSKAEHASETMWTRRRLYGHVVCRGEVRMAFRTLTRFLWLLV